MGLDALGVPAQLGPIYELALTHRSYAFENEAAQETNERLEFLGDAILGAVVTDLIFRDYPELSEGEMARLRASVVNTSALADVARAIGIGEHLRLGKGEDSSGGKDKSSLLADAFEALVGAVYIDQGDAVVGAALRGIFKPLISEVWATKERFDAKTALQEIAVKTTGELPRYRVASSGPDHDKQFSAHVYIDDELCGTGVGGSKKEAEQQAARAALKQLDRGARAR
ncbi:MAG: ribonuclease [Actinomycetota bacterium]|nr:ribonuclease [Actinomycetota bacterium]MEA2488135.1 ribonuclease [Actinomycetota bacterium]